MQKWSCILQAKSSEDSAQDIGLRPFIISRLIDYGLEKGDATNKEDEGKVEIRFEAETEENAKEICKNLEKDIEKEAHSKYSKLPKNFELTEVKKMPNPPLFDLPLLKDKADSLMLYQTSKGVGVMIKIAEGIEKLPDKIAKSLEKFMQNNSTKS